MRTKQEFKALREQTGITQDYLAQALGVRERSVRRWESLTESGYNAPQDAWDILDKALQMQRQVIATALGKIDETAKEIGTYPASVKLIYWSSQAEYDEHHCVDDSGDWRQANATARIVSYALHERGIETDWISGLENPVPKQ